MRIRDFIKDRITLSEELVQYREFKEEIIDISTNACLPQVAHVKRVQKFILHNGQEKLFYEDSKTIHFSGILTEDRCNFPNFRTSNSQSKIFTPLNNALNEIHGFFVMISDIVSYQSRSSSYATQNSQMSQELARKNQEVYQKDQDIAQKNREITEVQQKIAGLQTQESSLQSQVNSFQIGDTVKALNAKQKAHTLQKIWGSNDADSATVINAIKQYGFDPHYIHKNGQSLVQLAISRNDMALFDLLIANNIDFNDCIADLPNFQLVLTSGNNNFISRMLATGQDFSKSVLNAVLRDSSSRRKSA